MAETPATRTEQDYARFPAREEAANKTAKTVAQEDAATSKIQPKGEVPEAKANTFTDEAGKLLGTAQQAPTIQQEIDQFLAPYMNQLMNLGPEYGAEMEFLKPYLQPDSSALGPALSYTGPGADVVNKTTEAFKGAEEATAKAYENMGTPGFGQAAQLAKSYENTLPYQQPIAAQLGYGKYLETYGGLAPNTIGVPQDIQNLYKAIGGSSSTPSGLPPPGQAAAAGNANALLNTAQNQPSGHP